MSPPTHHQTRAELTCEACPQAGPIASFMSRVESKLDGICEAVNGDGSDDNPGMKIKIDRLERESDPKIKLRIDRLEQKEKGRAFYMKTAMTAAIGAVVLWLIDLFRTRP